MSKTTCAEADRWLAADGEKQQQTAKHHDGSHIDLMTVQDCKTAGREMLTMRNCWRRDCWRRDAGVMLAAQLLLTNCC